MGIPGRRAAEPFSSLRTDRQAVPGVRHGDSAYTSRPAKHSLLSLLSTLMNEQTILIFVLLGGAAGLAIVGVAFWMMRQENPAQTASTSPAQTPAQAADAGPAPEEASGGGSTDPNGVEAAPGAFVPEDIAVEPGPSSPPVPAAPGEPAAPPTPAPPDPVPAPAAARPSPVPLSETLEPLVEE